MAKPDDVGSPANLAEKEVPFVNCPTVAYCGAEPKTWVIVAMPPVKDKLIVKALTPIWLPKKSVPGIDWHAHLGGLIGGAIVAKIALRKRV